VYICLIFALFEFYLGVVSLEWVVTGNWYDWSRYTKTWKPLINVMQVPALPFKML